MTNSELVAHLQTLPPEKDVAIFWDGAARGEIEGIVHTSPEIILVGDWSIYRRGEYQAYPEKQIIFG